MKFELEHFESLAYTRQHEAATRELMNLLQALESQYGLLDSDQFQATPQSADTINALDDHVLCRLAAAITSLVTASDFQFTDAGFNTTLHLHRWLSAVFSASPFRNADHILRSFDISENKDGNLLVSDKNLLKFCLFYFAESEIPLDLNGLWQHHRKLATALCLALLSPRFLASPAAHQKREAMLPWLSERLAEVPDLDDLPNGILHDVYMHCSYADYPGKHDIKKPINRLIRRKLNANGLTDLPAIAKAPPEGKKPTLLVVLEWFSANHSIYRTHSLTIESMRQRFHVVGMGYPKCVDATGQSIFDEFIEIPTADDGIWKNLTHIRNVCLERNPQILYMPSVGMFGLTMFLANLRVAPLQVMGLGHPATTHSAAMDYVAVEEDYIGDPNCFSERLLILPKDGMPYRPSMVLQALTLNGTRDPAPAVTKIVVAATMMKLNPGFLSACAQIAQQAQSPVQFHFLIGQAQGLIYPQVHRLIKRFLGDKAVIYPHLAYPNYMQVIANCDLFLNPFPFGNTNGIVDTVYGGLVGICKTGPEVHEHIDEGLFRRLGFPDWLVTHDTEAYIAAALRLINNAPQRWDLSCTLTGPHAIEKIFTGRAEIFGEKLEALWQEKLH